jgi:tetratricopeptide (TPR) repeat protein
MSVSNEANNMNDPTPDPQNSVPPAEQLELKLPDESSDLKDIGLWAGVLVLLAMVVYWPATGGSFLWRDNVAVAENHLLAMPGGLGMVWLGRWQNPAGYVFATYEPITFTACWLEYRFGGHNDQGSPTPLAYHVANLVFHAGAAVLFWLILRELAVPGAWLAAAVFGLHPLNTEPVSWIADQSWTLGGMLFFGSAYTYLLFVKDREKDAAERAAGNPGVDPAQTWGFCATSLVLFVLAILANPATSPLPLVLLLALWWRGKLTAPDYVLLGPMFLAAAALWFSQGGLDLGGGVSLWHSGFAAQISAVGNALLSSWRIFLPVSFNIFHHPWPVDWWWVGALVALVWAAALVVLWMMRDRWGRGWFSAMVAIVLLMLCSLNWFDSSRAADRTDAGYYLAMTPLIAMVTASVVALLHRIKLPGSFAMAAVTLSAIVLLVFGGISWTRASVFDNPTAFWADAVVKDPKSSFAEAHLAEALRLAALDDATQSDKDKLKTDLQDSQQHAMRALDLDHNSAAAERTWANDLVANGDVKAALTHFERAAKMAPDDFQIRVEYGSALNAIGMYKESIPQLDEALRLDQTSAMTHRLLGDAYAHQGNTDRALSEEQQSIALDPRDNAARQSLAELLAKTGQIKDAITQYYYLLSQPENKARADLWLAVARLQDREQHFAFAVDSYKAALEVDPDNAEAKKAIEIDTEKARKQAATQPVTQPTSQPATKPL